MNIPAEFDKIRPYTPEELPKIYEELIADPSFRAVVESVMPGIPFEALAEKDASMPDKPGVPKSIFLRTIMGFGKEMRQWAYIRLFCLDGQNNELYLHFQSP